MQSAVQQRTARSQPGEVADITPPVEVLASRSRAVPDTRPNRLLFLGRWLRHPIRVGSVAPSGRALARALTRAATWGAGANVIELGAGTGAITAALLEIGVRPEQLVIIERDPALARVLRSRFPGCRVVQADAMELRSVCADLGVSRASAVISSLPRVGWSRGKQIAILEHSFELLGRDGVFVDYSYLPWSPLPRKLLKSREIRRNAKGWVAWNLPPARIWQYQRIADAQHRADSPSAPPRS